MNKLLLKMAATASAYIYISDVQCDVRSMVLLICMYVCNMYVCMYCIVLLFHATTFIILLLFHAHKLGTLSAMIDIVISC